MLIPRVLAQLGHLANKLEHLQVLGLLLLTDVLVDELEDPQLILNLDLDALGVAPFSCSLDQVNESRVHLQPISLG